MMHLVLWMLRLYPPAWRERYETEMIALLEQHHVTHWTVLDLCIGVLDARLDPQYHRVQPLSAGPRLPLSWGLMMGAWVAFLFTSFFWLRVSSLALPDQVGHWVEILAPLPYQILALRTLLTYITLLPLCIAVPVWLVIQTLEHNRWNALRFLPFLAALLLFPFLSWWQEEILGVMLMVALALESGGLLLTIARRWMLRHQFMSALLALVVTGSMVLMCIVNGVWTGTVWQLIPQVRPIDPQWQMSLVLQLVLMLLTTAVALVGCVHGLLARRASDLPSPKQEPGYQVFEQD